MERKGLILQAACGDRKVGAWRAEDGPITIGRWDGATLRLDDADLLPVQVVLDPEGAGQWRLVVLRPDGCLVNGRPVRRAVVGPGDTITVGPYELSVDGSGAYLAPGADGGELPLKASLYWRDTLLETKVVEPGEALSLGRGRGNTFFVPPELLGAEKPRVRWPAAVCIDDRWHVALDTPLRAMDAAEDHPLLTTGVRTDGPKFPRGSEQPRTWTTLEAGARVRLAVGDLSVVLERAPRHRMEVVRRPARWRTNEGQAAIIGLLLLLFLMAVLQVETVAPFLPEYEEIKRRELIAQFHRPIEEPKETERVKRLRSLAKDEKKQSEGAARAEGKEGVAGRPDAKGQTGQRAGPKSDEEVVREHALLQALQQSGGQIVSGGTLGAASSVGNLAGSHIGDGEGTFGLGLRGTGQGGGGMSRDTVGVGPVGTRGEGFGDGVGQIGRGGPSSLGIDEPGRVEGGLDREVIRRVILSHRAQIRYCYEKRLNTNPGLQGKVVVEFVIGADGKVTSARAAEQTLADPEVANCLISKLKGWTFPEPKGGGVVVVTYPFLFKPSGG